MRRALLGRLRRFLPNLITLGLLPALVAMCGLAFLPAPSALAGPPAALPAAPNAVRLVPLPPLEGGTVTASAFDGQNRLTFGIGPEITKPGQERPAFNYGVTPGAKASDGAEVLNLSQVPISVSVYPSDVLNNRDGTTSFPPGGTKPRDVGSWITLEIPGNTNTVTVPARAGVIIPLKFSVPPGAQPGDHVGGIVAALESTAKNASGVFVHLDQRVATRAFFRVSGALKPRVTVEKLHPVYQQNYSPIGFGNVKATFTVANEGNVRVGVTTTVEFHGLLGVHRVDTHLAAISVLYPGGSDAMTVQFLHLFPGLLGSVTVNVEVTPVLGDADPPLHPVSAQAHVLAPPLTLILLLIAALGAGWERRRRRRKGPLRGRTPPAGAASTVEADDVGTTTSAVP